MKKFYILFIGLVFLFCLMQKDAFSQLTIGGNNYTTLSAAFNAINNGTETGAIVINVNNSTLETVSAELNASGTGSASYTSVLIKPTVNNVIIEGDVAGALINLSGADNVTIDGRVGSTNTRQLTIRNNNNGANSAAIRMTSLGVGLGATNNTVTWCNIWGGSTTPGTASFGVYIAGATISITGTGADNDNNVVTNNHIRKCTHGIFSRGTSAANSNENNNFSNNLIGSENPSEYVVVTGIDMTNSTNVTISGNVILNIISFHTTVLRGMSLSGGMSNVTITGNTIRNIENNTTSSFVSGQGIFISGTGAVNATIANNVIAGLHGRGSTTAASNTWGILVSAGNNYNIYYNSISLYGEGTPTLATSNDRGGNIMFASLSSSGLNVVNNALYNTRIPSNTTGGFSNNINSLAPAGNFVSINYNDYYGTGDRYSVGFLGSERLTLADWQAATGQDMNSINLNPLFASETNLSPIPGSPLIGAGTPIVGITTDITGATRSGTTPSIGAYENAVNAGPIISYDLLSNTASGGNRNLENVTIVDPDGIAVGALAPRVYWRVNGGSWVSSATSSVNSPFNFTIGTTGLTSGDVVDYFVVAQDLLGAVSASPSLGFAATNVNNVTSYPFAPNSYSIVPTLSGTYTVGTGENYTNVTAIANLLNDGNSLVTGNVIFELTNNYDGTSGESLPIIFNEFLNAGTFTVTIRPASGVTNRITEGDPGSAFSTPVINLIGAKHLIFDGRPGGVGTNNEWTIRNTRTAATIGCGIRLADDAAYNILRNLNLQTQQNSLTTTGVIFLHTSVGTIGNSLNTIENNMISGRSDAPGTLISNGILSNGTASAPNTANTIKGNHIFNFNNIGVSIVATGNGPDWIIEDNHFYNPVHVSASAQTGINIASLTSTGMLVSNNFIGGSGPGATGMMTNSGNVLTTGILIANGISTVSNNTISNITSTGTGTAARIQGISQTSTAGACEITNNTITNLSTTSTATGMAFGNQVARGIYIGPSGQFVGSNITGNTIDNISIESTNALTISNVAAGIAVYNLQLGTVAGNKISNIKNKTTGITAGQFPIACGIFTSFFSDGAVVNNMISLGSGENTNTQFAGMIQVGNGASNNHHYYFNSVAITGTAGGDINSFGFLRGTDTATVQNQVSILRNNSFYIDRAGAGSSNYAVANKGAVAELGWSSDFNMLFSSNIANLGFWNATSYNFSGWKTISMGDVSSLSPDVLAGSDLFTNIATGDLSVNAANVASWLLNGNATQIAGINFDFNGNPRSDVVEDGAPDIGAVEFLPSVDPPSIVTPVTVEAISDVLFAGKLIASVNVTTGGTLTHFTTKYFSGTYPVAPGTNGKNGNSLWNIVPNPGATGFICDISLYYTPAILGDITSENNVRMVKTSGSLSAPWMPFLVEGTGPEQYQLNTVTKSITVFGFDEWSFYEVPNTFAITDADFPLPVDIVSFTATVDRNNVTLNWTTAWEENNARFDIQRRVAESEGVWTTVGSVNGSGTVYEERSYAHIDKNLVTGKYEYRLVQIDFDGNSTADFNLSQAVEVGIPTTFALAQNYPNPFNPTTKIDFQIPIDGFVKISIFDMSGREVAVLVNEAMTPGYYTYDFNGASLSSGAYFYRLVTSNSVITKKMMLVK